MATVRCLEDNDDAQKAFRRARELRMAGRRGRLALVAGPSASPIKLSEVKPGDD